MAIGIGVVGVVDAIAILRVFYLGMQRYPGHLEAAQTMAFVTLCISELLRAFTARSEYHSVFSIGVVLQPLDGLGGGRFVPAGADWWCTCRSCSRSSTRCR